MADDIPTEVVEAAMDALAMHRWKTIGISSVECECGEIVYEPGTPTLSAFPADEAFRRHLANVVLQAALPHLPQHVSPSVEDIAEEIRRHSKLRDEVDGVFYCGWCGEGDAGSPLHLAERVLALLSSRPTVEQVRRPAWIEGALWALYDQGNEITPWLRNSVERHYGARAAEAGETHG